MLLKYNHISLFFTLLIFTLLACDPIPREDKSSPQPKDEDVVFKGEIIIDDTTDFDGDIENLQFENTYYYAQNYLLKKGEYHRAIQVFESLIKQNSKSKLADNCQFWIGVCYYNLEDYSKALIAFEAVFEYAPDEVKTKDTQKWIQRIKNELKN